MEWFKHKTASMDDPDIIEAEDLFGDSGYNVFFKVLELYGKEYNHVDKDGFLRISLRVVARKLRKRWTKVELYLNYYQTKSRFFWTYDENDAGYILLKIPDFIDIVSNWTRRPKKKPTEAPTEAPTAREEEEEEEEEIKNIKKVGAFDKFYSEYPLKKGKQAALKAWVKNKPNLEVCLKAIKAQKAEHDMLKSSNKFCPEWKHPATWINQGCWDDETVTMRDDDEYRKFLQLVRESK